jgi:hypothetical protein
MSKFIYIQTGVVNKDSVTGLTRCKGTHPWNGKEYYSIIIHLQGTTEEVEYDNKFERNQELERLIRELDN